MGDSARATQSDAQVLEAGCGSQLLAVDTDPQLLPVNQNGVVHVCDSSIVRVVEHCNKAFGDGDEQSIVVTEFLQDARCENEVLDTVRR
jgi:hypothetical protein